MLYNLNIPILQSNESIYSFVKRAAVLNCLNKRQICSLLEIKTFTQANVLNKIDEIIEIFNLKKSPRELFTKHSLFALFRFTLSLEEIDSYYRMFDNRCITNYLFFNYLNENLLCPICAKEDIAKYGYPIKKIYVNYVDNYVCPKHKVKTVVFNDFINRIADLNKPIQECVDDNAIAYSKWTMRLYKANIKNPCLERTEKLLISRINFFSADSYAITKEDSRILY